MDFIIQHNMLSNDILLPLLEAVKGLPHQFVGLIPFSREITSNQPIMGLDHIPYGSTSFVETTYELGWKGLSFDKKYFSYNTACHARSDMLNEGRILPAVEMVDYLRSLDPEDSIFMRPDPDLKQFSGSVYIIKEALDFLIDAMACTSSGSYKIEPDFLIVASQPKEILGEWRWFVVNGKVIDGSSYRLNGRLGKIHVEGGSFHNNAQELADKWLPSPCCVMDIALLPDSGFKVIEFNCINGSGFYNHDMKKIMKAWWDYHNG